MFPIFPCFLLKLFRLLILFSLAMQEISKNQCTCCSILHMICSKLSIFNFRLHSCINSFASLCLMFSGQAQLSFIAGKYSLGLDRSTECYQSHYPLSSRIHKVIIICLSPIKIWAFLTSISTMTQKSIDHYTRPGCPALFLFFLSVSSSSKICLDIFSMFLQIVSSSFSKYQNIKSFS